jgi:hypothetical protein
MALREFAYDAIAPLRGPPLVLVLVVTPLTVLAQSASMFGLPLLMILAGWIWSYTFLIVEALAEGLQVPVLSIERTNPWHEPRALVPPLLVLAVGWVATVPAGRPQALVLIVAALLAALMPASLALLAAGCGLGRALWPPALVAVVLGLGTRYLGILLVGVIYTAALATLGRRMPALVLVAAGQLALYSFGSLLGRSLFRRREALGLDAIAAPERDHDRAAALSDREAEALATRIYGLLRVKRETEAWHDVETWLERKPADPTPCRWLRDRALAWSESRFADRLDGVLVMRLVAAGRLGEAVATVEACWSRGGTLASQSAPALAALIDAAARMGHESTAARLAQSSVQDKPDE